MNTNSMVPTLGNIDCGILCTVEICCSSRSDLWAYKANWIVGNLTIYCALFQYYMYWWIMKTAYLSYVIYFNKKANSHFEIKYCIGVGSRVLPHNILKFKQLSGGITGQFFFQPANVKGDPLEYMCFVKSDPIPPIPPVHSPRNYWRLSQGLWPKGLFNLVFIMIVGMAVLCVVFLKNNVRPHISMM